MDDAQSEWLTKEFARLRREYNTPELARELLQSYGMLDENGDLAERHRSTHCQQSSPATTAGFRELTHLRLCVRDKRQVQGVFPLPEEQRAALGLPD
jgi:hypothetical protein